LFAVSGGEAEEHGAAGFDLGGAEFFCELDASGCEFDAAKMKQNAAEIAGSSNAWAR
jgi:hypothetical protein